MRLGRKYITVQELYDYALLNNYTKADALTVIDIINKENNMASANVVDFKNIIHYTVEDLLNLFG